MIRVVSWFSMFAVLVLVVTTLLLIALPRDPFRQPGETWRFGFLSGYSVRLLESGRYVDSNWCDVCLEERSFGTWRHTPEGYELFPDSGNPSWRLLRVEREGCSQLAGPPVRRGGEPVYFSREGDLCAARR